MTEDLKKSAMPSTVRLFPLPNHVLLPDFPVPYRVFEPRYKKLVEDLLAVAPEDRWISVPRLAGEEEGTEEPAPFERVATVGKVTVVERDPDGDYRIVVRGLSRSRLTEEPSEQPYRVASVRPMPDLPDDEAEVEERFGTILQLIASLTPFLEDSGGIVAAALEGSPDRSTASYRLGSIFILDADWRQRLLEARQLVARLAILENALASTLALAAGSKEADTPRA